MLSTPGKELFESNTSSSSESIVMFINQEYSSLEAIEHATLNFHVYIGDENTKFLIGKINRDRISKGNK